ncbi:MAG: hypothetical protein HY284_02390 [Nitrospirae bacterium]|nr:hypothetical protein [Nitrospirota bacterium]
MRTDTRQRKHAMAGLRAISGDQQLLGVLTRVLHSDKQALDAVMLEMGWIVAESVILIEREEVAGPDYYFSLVRHSERNIKRTRGSRMLQRWLGTVLLYCEKQFERVKGFAGIAQVTATIEAEQAEQPSAPTKKAA